MEDTLRVNPVPVYLAEVNVLILILMEDTLRAAHYRRVNNLHVVLILILMEDTLRVIGDVESAKTRES